ncbi:MAG: FkbM family methyltransferase [Candidatus Sericytochromatia bacterium]
MGSRLFPYAGELKWQPLPGKNLKMYSDGQDSIVSGLYVNGTHEEEITWFFLKACQPGMTFVDIGANTGYFSLLAAGCFDAVRVLAFEPVPRVLTYLHRNIALNKLNSQIQVFEVALSHQNGQIEFYEVDSVTLPLGSSANKDFRLQTRAYQVQMNRLDDLAGELALGKVALVKIDTESTEHEVIEGMISLIQTSRPVIICEILYDPVGEAVQAFLEPLNYRFYSLRPQGLLPEKEIRLFSDAYNHAFIPIEDTRFDAFVLKA